MKIVKSILYVIIGIIALALVTALFIKKDYAVSRVITINKPKDSVFAYVKLLKNQDYFSVWATKDPAMKKEFRGTDGSVGFVSAWDSQKDDVGKGEQEIKQITEGRKIDYELRFIKPFEATDYAHMSTDSAGADQTRVTWGFNGHMNYPMNLMLVFMNMDKMLGDDLEGGLKNLKNVMEK